MVVRAGTNASWRQLAQLFSLGQISIVPGLTLTGVIILARILGLFQVTELKTLDLFLRWRPLESVDQRVLIVGINEADIQQVETYPIPDGVLARLIRKLGQHQPRAIGLDIVRDLPEEPGHQALVNTFEELPYVFGVESLPFDGQSGDQINPPPGLPDEQVGFVNFPLDSDGLIRRSLLGSFYESDEDNESARYEFSFALLLAQEYLSHEQLTLENGIKDPNTMRFGDTELPRFESNTGGYVGASSGGHQTLLNVRNNPQAFRQVSMHDVINGAVDPDWIRDRIVLIGVTATSHKDFARTEAIPQRNSSQIYGVEMHAHMVSQILDAVLDNRPLLKTWAEAGEYLWILGWGLLGIVLITLRLGTLRYLLLIITSVSGLVAIGVYGILWGLWIPIVPTFIVFVLNGIVLQITFQFYTQMFQMQIEAGQKAIKQAYNATHSGPLQTLNLILQNSEQTPDWPIVIASLRQLDEEIRSVFDYLEKEVSPNASQLYLPKGKAILELDDSLQELLHAVYAYTTDHEQFKKISTIKWIVPEFEPMRDRHLTLDQKRDLCLFLEETLTNVGKHAKDATRLTIRCTSNEDTNTILVEDNGQGLQHKSAPPNGSIGGRGTKEAKQLAKQLGGRYCLQQRVPHGVRCMLQWPAYPQRFRAIRKLFFLNKY